MWARVHGVWGIVGALRGKSRVLGGRGNVWELEGMEFLPKCVNFV